PSRTLAEAERMSSEVFREAGITLLWVGCGGVDKKSLESSACAQVSDPLHLVLKVVPESMAARLRQPPRVFGLAVEADAFIFFGRIQMFSAIEGVSETVILGHAMAHEVGHMVLRQHNHSPSGIMMKTFRKDALQRAEKGHLLF